MCVCVCAHLGLGEQRAQRDMHTASLICSSLETVYSTVWTGAGAQLVERLFSTQEALGWTPHYHINEMRRCMSYMSVILEPGR